MSRIGFYVLSTIIIWFVGSQIISPIITGEPFFNLFRKRKEKQIGSKETTLVNIEDEINKVQQLIIEQESEIERGSNEAKIKLKEHRLKMVELLKQKERIN